METCALFSLFRRLSSRACASAVFEKQPSLLHLSLAIFWFWASCGWRFRFSPFAANSLTYSVLGVKVSPLLFLHPLFTWFFSSPFFPSVPTLVPHSDCLITSFCIKCAYCMNSQNLRWRQGWRKNGGETFTLNPFMHNVLRGKGEDVNIKVENRRMRVYVRPREMWRNVHGVKKRLCILMRFPSF